MADVVWTSVVGCSASGNNLTKTAPNGWDAGAVSVASLPAGDGYVEVTGPNPGFQGQAFGLSVGDSNQHYSDIDFAIYLQYVGSGIAALEGGVFKSGLGVLAAGDILRVGVEGGVVKYRVNGVLKYTSLTAPTYPLLVDCSIYDNGASITGAVTSFSADTALAGSAVCEAVATATLLDPALAGSATAAATSSAALTTGIALAGIAVCEAIASAELAPSMAGSAVCEAVATADLTTEILLAISGAAVCEAVAFASWPAPDVGTLVVVNSSFGTVVSGGA